MDGSQVYQAYLDGKLEDIRRYCETDVMNTYLLYCRYQKMRGGFTEAEYEREIEFVKESLGALAEVSASAVSAGSQGGDTHWQEYLAAWA
jgi:predicted PolB exonuclease-like 3'-5' exonuclease